MVYSDNKIDGLKPNTIFSPNGLLIPCLLLNLPEYMLNVYGIFFQSQTNR